MPKVNLLILTTTFQEGGCEKTIYELVRGIDQNQFQVTVAALLGSGKIGEKLKEEGFKVYTLEMRHYFDFSVFSKLRKIIKENRIQILHSFLFHANLIGRIASFLFRVPINISSIRTMEKEKNWHLVLDRITKPLVNYEITNSEKVLDFMVKETKSKKEKISCIYNGVKIPDHLKRGHSMIPRKLPHSVYVGTIGSLEKAKNHELFIEVANRIINTHANFYFFIIGEGSRRPILERIIQEKGIRDRVTLLGAVENAQNLIPEMDVFLLTSAWEGFPNVILEAMASKTPIITTNAGGIGEIIQDDENGILIDSNDPEIFEFKILELTKDKRKQKRIAENAFYQVTNDFKLPKMVSQYEAKYRELLENHKIPVTF